MKNKAFIFGIVLGLLLIVSISCSKDFETKQVAEVTLSELSAQYHYQNTTSEIGQLGRVLFYDKSDEELLSVINTGGANMPGYGWLLDSENSARILEYIKERTK